MPDVSCNQCSNIFYVTPHRFARNDSMYGGRFFCSRKCNTKFKLVHGVYSGSNNSQWRGGSPGASTFVCEVCGELFKRYLSKKKTSTGKVGRFCSRKCMIKWRSATFDHTKLTYRRALKNQVHIPADTTFAAYLAGFFDGEGSIVTQHYHSKGDQEFHYQHLTLTNTDRDVMLWLHDNLGGGCAMVRQHVNPKYKPTYTLQFESMLEVKSVLEAMLPYLHIKKDKALEALRLINARLAKTGLRILC